MVFFAFRSAWLNVNLDAFCLRFKCLKCFHKRKIKPVLIPSLYILTNSFTYVKPSSCYPRKNINNAPRGIALRLRWICDTDEKFESRANEYKQYLLARDYKPSLVDKQFQEVSKITRTEARAKRPKNNQVSKIKFLTTYNPSLPKIDGIIRKHLPLLHSDDSLKKLFPANIFSTIFKRNKNLKEILAPSKYPNPKNSRQNSITSCNKCDICKNYMVFDRTCKCTDSHGLGVLHETWDELWKYYYYLLHNMHEIFRTVCWLCYKI